MKKTILTILAAGVVILVAASIQAGSVPKIPDFITLDSLTDKYESVVFTHERHAALAGDCGKCHHEHGQNAKLPCKDCHSLDVAAFKNSVTHNFTACKSCHSSPSPENPGMPGLMVAYHSKCMQCHKGMGNVGKDPTGCTELCHAKRNTALSKTLK